MKTGIIIYSSTGNTRKAARQLLEAIEKKGQQATLLEVKASNEKPEMDGKKIHLTEQPDPSGFDRLVFASPVWGFSLSGVMQAYLSALPSLKGKSVSLFVTHRFPLPFLGGNRTIKQMAALCREKGGMVGETSVISWSQNRREDDIARMVQQLA